MEESPQDAAQGPLGRLLASLGDFFATLLTIGRTRLELLTVEVQLEVRRLAVILAWGVVALAGAVMALLMAGVTIIVVFWDTHRVVAAVAVTCAYLAVAATSALVLAARIRAKPRMLDETLNELARDSEQLHRPRP